MHKILLTVSILLIFSCTQTTRSDKTSENNETEPISWQKDNTQLETDVETNSLHTEPESFDSTKCNDSYILTVIENIDNLDTTMISDLLRTIDESCSNNVEFGEFSNETLFMVLEKRPDLFLQSFHKLSSKLDTAYILFELRNPIHDLIPIREIIEDFEQIDFESESKDAILKNLKQGDWTK